MPKTLTQLTRRTPGARTWMRSGSKFSPTSKDDGMRIAGEPARFYTIHGVKKEDGFPVYSMTTTTPGSSLADAVDRYLRIMQPAFLKKNPFAPVYEAHELTATEAL